MSTYKTVNAVQLADEIASKVMDDRYHGEGWQEESEEDPGVLHPKSEKVQDEYNDLYDEAHQLINDAEYDPKVLVHIDEGQGFVYANMNGIKLTVIDSDPQVTDNIHARLWYPTETPEVVDIESKIEEIDKLYKP